MLICPDCGAKLNYHYDQKNPKTQYYNCSAYNNSKAKCGKSHYIRLDFLAEIVLSELNRTIHYARRYPGVFARAVENNSFISDKIIHEDLRKGLEPMLQRNKELDILFAHIFEDKAKGALSEERFSRLIGSFGQEQTALEERIQTLKSQIQKVDTHHAFPEKFIQLIDGMGEIAALDRALLFKYIDHIEVFHAEPLGNERIQTIKIHYNHVGFFEVPMPSKDVITTMPRKGIVLRYVSYSEYSNVLGSEN